MTSFGDIRKIPPNKLHVTSKLVDMKYDKFKISNSGKNHFLEATVYEAETGPVCWVMNLSNKTAFFELNLVKGKENSVPLLHLSL